MSGFRDQVVVITGASAGIGRELALLLAEQGARLALAARSATRLEEVAAECRRAGASVVAVVTDVGQAEDCRRLIEQTVAAFGQIDTLVNNAGAAVWARFDAIEDLAQFERLMRVNYLGNVYCTHFALPWLKKSRGRLVAVASVAGLVGSPWYTAYAPTKHAQFGFFDSLRIELQQEKCGVSVTVVAPDFVASDIHRTAVDGQGRPLPQSPWDESRFPSARHCARQILRAMQCRRRQAILSWRGWWAHGARLHCPWLLDAVTAWLSRGWGGKNLPKNPQEISR